MGAFFNINRHGEIIENSDNVIIKGAPLFNEFEKFIVQGGFKIVKWIDRSSPFEMIIEGEQKYHLCGYLKCVSGSGWADKPWVKRIQIKNIKKENREKYINTTKEDAFIILGLYFYDDVMCLVAWRGCKYTMHETARSCYIDVSLLQKAVKDGYCTGISSKQKIWVATPKYLDKLLKDYIEFNIL